MTSLCTLCIPTSYIPQIYIYLSVFHSYDLMYYHVIIDEFCVMPCLSLMVFHECVCMYSITRVSNVTLYLLKWEDLFNSCRTSYWFACSLFSSLTLHSFPHLRLKMIRQSGAVAVSDPHFPVALQCDFKRKRAVQLLHLLYNKTLDQSIIIYLWRQSHNHNAFCIVCNIFTIYLEFIDF